MNQKQHQLMRILQKISVFQGLEVSEAERLIRICRFHQYEENERIYNVGQDSSEMLVLMQGKLLVVGPAGNVFGEVTPGQPTGEMGVFTGHGRSANIVSAVKSAALIIQKKDIDELLHQDWEIKSKVLQNVVDLLSKRLKESNKLVAKYRTEVEELKAEVAEQGSQVAEDGSQIVEEG